MGRAAIVFAAFLLLGPFSAAHADFYDGLRAYDAGDYAAAVKEWHLAADQGDAQAQYRLGRLYEEGRGVPQNFMDAHHWYNLAASRGHAEAREARGSIAERMTTEELAEARKLAADWQPAAETAEADVRAEKVAPTMGPEALLAAAAAGDAERVETLLAAGADPNAATPDGWTALMVAAAEGHYEAVEALVAAGAEVHVRSADDATPLLLAILGGHDEVVQQLLVAGRTWTTHDLERARALAEARGFEELAAMLRPTAPGALKSQRLKSRRDGEARRAADTTPEALFKAAETGGLERVQAILEQGVDVNSADEDGWTALMFAIAGGHADVAKALLETGAAVDVTGEAGGVSGWTPLMFAAATGDEEIVQALLEAGAEPRTENAQGLTARVVAEQKGHEQVAKLLPRPGPVVDERVREVQRLLAELGYDPGPADGIMGPRTQEAIQGYSIRFAGELKPVEELLPYLRNSVKIERRLHRE